MPPMVGHLLYSLKVGGAELLAARLARKLRGQFRFAFACLDELGSLGEELRQEGFPVHVLGRRPGWDWLCPVRVANWLRREHIDLLQAHQYSPFFYGIAGRLLCRKPPVLFTEHGRQLPDYPRRKRMIFNRWLLEGRDRVVGVGLGVKHALVTNEGIAAERIGVIYNGIDLSTFGNGVHDREAVRRELGLGPGDFVLIQVARLDYLKDHLTAIRTLHRLVECRANVRLVLVGEGPERAKIEREIADKQVRAAVRLLGLRNDIPRLLRAADLFLLTSISEGIPLTVLEAMAAGLPVVATNVGGLAEIIEHNVTGLLAPSGDHDAVAAGVLSVIEDPTRGRTLARAGQERVRNHFSEAQMLEQYANLYREMLRG